MIAHRRAWRYGTLGDDLRVVVEVGVEVRREKEEREGDGKPEGHRDQEAAVEGDGGLGVATFAEAVVSRLAGR